MYVAQVDRQGCALILADTWTEKIGKGLMFISLNGEPATPESAIAASDELRAELEAKGVGVKEGSWGYWLLVVDDPDGNQLFFNNPSETALRQDFRRRVTPQFREGSNGWQNISITLVDHWHTVACAIALFSIATGKNTVLKYVGGSLPAAAVM